MKFNPNDYISPSESIVITGTVRTSYLQSDTLKKFTLTNEKMIIAAEDYLKIIPLNQISGIAISGDDYKKLFVYAGGRESVELAYSGNPSWYNEIAVEISKLIG